MIMLVQQPVVQVLFINCFYSWSGYSGDAAIDSDSSVDSHDIGNCLRYNSYNSDNNEYLQELGIDSNVNKNNYLSIDRDDDILQKRKKKRC